jgi:hypothetical protein
VAGGWGWYWNILGVGINGDAAGCCFFLTLLIVELIVDVSIVSDCCCNSLLGGICNLGGLSGWLCLSGLD